MKIAPRKIEDIKIVTGIASSRNKNALDAQNLKLLETDVSNQYII